MRVLGMSCSWMACAQVRMRGNRNADWYCILRAIMRDMHIKGESMRTAAIAAVAACLMALGGCAAMIPAMHAGAAAVAAHAAAAPIAAGAAAAGTGVGIGVLISDDVKRAIQSAKEMQIGPQDPGTFGAFLADSHTAVQSL